MSIIDYWIINYLAYSSAKLYYNMATYNHFYDLPVYKVCSEFRKKVIIIANGYFPKTEEYLLKSQLFRSSRSVTANIAEGFGRFHYQENIQFCRQARGSLAESMEHLITTFDHTYIKRHFRRNEHRLQGMPKTD